MASTSRLPQPPLSPNARLLFAASAGDLTTIEELLTNPDEKSQAQPWYESEDLGWSALHFAAENGHTHVVKYLLKNGAIWNAVDVHGITAGEVAWSANWDQTYAAILQFGVGQTLLLSALEDAGADEDSAGEDEVTQKEQDGEIEPRNDASGSSAKMSQDASTLTLSAPAGELANSNTDFLTSRLRFFVSDDAKGKRRERCMDADDNMVMSGWETEIMRRSADALCKGREGGLRILNVGYGLGIVDEFFQEYKPSRHVIIEPHPDVIDFFRKKPISQAAGVELVAQRWEEALANPELGEFDVIYADPFAQDYKDLKKLFELLPNLLSGPEATFSFFHGLAGTNRFL